MKAITKNFILLLGGILACMTGNWLLGGLIGAAAGALNGVFAGIANRRSAKSAIIALAPASILCAVVCGFGAQMAGPELISVNGILFSALTCFLCVTLGTFLQQSKLVEEQEEDRAESRAHRHEQPPAQNQQQARATHQTQAQVQPVQPVATEAAEANSQNNTGARRFANIFGNKGASLAGDIQPTASVVENKGAVVIDGEEYSSESVEEIKRVLCLEPDATLKSAHIELFLNTISNANRAKYSGSTTAELINNYCSRTSKEPVDYYIEQDQFFMSVPKSFLLACVPRSFEDYSEYLFGFYNEVNSKFIRELPPPLCHMPSTILIELIPPSERFGDEAECIINNKDYLLELFDAQLPVPLKYIPVRTLWLALPKDKRANPNAPMVDIRSNGLSLINDFKVDSDTRLSSPLEYLLPSWCRGLGLQTMLDRLTKIDPILATEKSSPWIKVLNHIDWVKTDVSTVTEETDTPRGPALTDHPLLKRAPVGMIACLIKDSVDIYDDDMSDEDFVKKYINRPEVQASVFCEELPKPLNKIPLMMLKTLVYDKESIQNSNVDEVAAVRQFILLHLPLFTSLFSGNGTDFFDLVPLPIKECVKEEDYAAPIDPDQITEDEYWRLWLPSKTASMYIGELLPTDADMSDPELWLINNFSRIKT